MIKCIVVDDEQPAIDVLVKYINDTPYLELVAQTTNIFEVSEILNREKIDILFLDIHMPNITGLQFLSLYNGDTKIILTTAYPEYALQSYEHEKVVDYLLKPISYKRFLKSTEKVMNMLNSSFVTSTTNSQALDFILVKTEHKGKLQKINLREVVYIESMGNYIVINTEQKEKIITYMGLTEIEGSLNKDMLIRVHRSYIISVSRVEAIDGNEVVIKGGLRVPMAGKFKEAFLEIFQKNII